MVNHKKIKQYLFQNVYQNAGNGYVITPSELALEMISALPESVFDSETTTFLDPICKNGTFLFEIVEKLYHKGHSIENISKRIYTIDSNSHSTNLAEATIRKILNQETIGSKIDFKSDFTQRFYDRMMFIVSSGKFRTIESFLDIITLNKSDLKLMSDFKNGISDFIQKYEAVSKLESKLFGEVFTPRQLIDEMLDTLPKDIWKNPDLKWLDPAVGIGNFPATILDRLMVGLDSVIPSEDERRKHILENMLYMCDISTKNLFLLYMLFDKNNEFKLNVYRGSFLDEAFDKHMKEVWGLEGFDVVVGNPPYNENGTGTGNSIWQKFLEKADVVSLQYIVYIHPCSWRMPLRVGDRFYKSSQIIKNTAEYVRILSKEEANKFFGLSIRVDYCLLNKKKLNKKSLIENENEKVYLDISNLYLVPNYNFDLFERLTNSNKKCEVIYSSKYDPRSKYVSMEKNEEFKYPLILSTPKSGIRYAYSSTNQRGHFDIPKVIFGDSGINHVIIDMSGEYGMTQHGIGIKVSSEDEAIKIKSALLSEDFSEFLKSVQWSHFQIDYRLFTQLSIDFYKQFLKTK